MEKKYGVQWLKEGERNTKFFHQSTIQRRHTNIINKLWTAQGDLITSWNNIENELITF